MLNFIVACSHQSASAEGLHLVFYFIISNPGSCGLTSGSKTPVRGRVEVKSELTIKQNIIPAEEYCGFMHGKEGGLICNL